VTTNPAIPAVPELLRELRALDPEALIDTLHPNDELTGDHSTEAGFQARTLLRYLTHAVQGSDVARSVPNPHTSGTLIALAGQMTGFLAQLLEHLAARQRRLAEDPRITVDAAGRQHGGLDTVAELTAINLESAAGRLGEAAVLLRTATSYADSLDFEQPGEPERSRG